MISPHCAPAFSVAHWEQLQQEKEELEHRFQAELLRLRAQQQRELGELEERLKVQHMAEIVSLQAQQSSELEELRVRQEEQVCAFRSTLTDQNICFPFECYMSFQRGCARIIHSV